MKTITIGRITGLGLVTALTLSASAQHSVPVTQCWQKSSGGGSESWTARVLSVGNKGAEIFTCTGPLIDYTRLYSAYDSASPPQEMMHEASSIETQRHRVDSATERDVHVSLYDVDSPTGVGNIRDVVVNKYSGTELDWTYTFPLQTNAHQNTFVSVSNDGETIVAAAQNIFNGFSFDVAFFAADYPNGVANVTPVHFTPPGLFRDFGVSSDGSTFFIAGTSGLQVGSTATKQITHLGNFPFGENFRSRFAISGSGRFIAYATDNFVRILERTSSTYELRTTYAIPGSYSFESFLDISDNDAVLACGINYPPDIGNLRVTAFDLLAPGGPSVLYSDLLVGGGTHNDKVSDISVSENGNRFVVGTWGDDLELIPEVLIYSANHSQPIATVDLPGSVWDLEMAPDGKSFAVGFKHIHANVFANATTSYALYEIGKRDFRMTGLPKIGNPLEFTLKVREGATGKLLVGVANPNYTPVDIHGWGVSYVDPSSWSILPLGVGNANHQASRTISTAAPHFAQLAGQTLVFQGLSLDQRSFSRNWVQATLVP